MKFPAVPRKHEVSHPMAGILTTNRNPVLNQTSPSRIDPTQMLFPLRILARRNLPHESDLIDGRVLEQHEDGVKGPMKHGNYRLVRKVTVRRSRSALHSEVTSMLFDLSFLLVAGVHPSLKYVQLETTEASSAGSSRLRTGTMVHIAQQLEMTWISPAISRTEVMVEP